MSAIQKIFFFLTLQDFLLFGTTKNSLSSFSSKTSREKMNMYPKVRIFSGLNYYSLFMILNQSRIVHISLVLAISYNRRIYHQEVLNLAAPDFLLDTCRLTYPTKLFSFQCFERNCYASSTFDLHFWTTNTSH